MAYCPAEAGAIEGRDWKGAAGERRRREGYCSVLHYSVCMLHLGRDVQVVLLILLLAAGSSGAAHTLGMNKKTLWAGSGFVGSGLDIVCFPFASNDPQGFRGNSSAS